MFYCGLALATFFAETALFIMGASLRNCTATTSFGYFVGVSCICLACVSFALAIAFKLQYDSWSWFYSFFTGSIILVVTGIIAYQRSSDLVDS